MPDAIVLHPDSRLKTRAEPVVEVTPEVRERALGLARLMNEGGEDGSTGIGLAATQVGWPVRIVVVKTIERPGRWGEDKILVNPRVMAVGGGIGGAMEGCLSFPGVQVVVERPMEVAVEATDLDGKPVQVCADGIVARCLQHELDHLDGITMLDRTTAARRAAVAGRLKELESR